MEEEIMANNVFPLLKLPAGVETVLLPFVASGTGGLQAILNLRQVCSTTKSWVDALPTRQGKPLFSKAKVRMDSEVDTLERFLESPPPFAVSALSLDIKAVLNQNPTVEQEELWAQFCAAWLTRLETLELRKELDDNVGIFYNNRRMSNLFEAPNLRVLRLNSIRVLWNMPVSVPSSVYKVTELSINLVTRFQLYRFYSELKKNPNLRKLETFIYSATELECLQNFIDAKKEDAGLEMSIIHVEDSFRPLLLENEVEDEYKTKCLKFAESVVASKSTVRLHLLSDYNLEHWNGLLPRRIALEMFEKVESVEIWRPWQNALSLLEDLPRLKEVKVETQFGPAVAGRRLNELTFPPSLETLSFTAGFPAIRNLPVALRSLTLEDFSCDVTQFVNSLNLLKTQCAGLETLRVTWKCETSKTPTKNIEKSPGFDNLRSLTFECDLFKKDVRNLRAVLQRGFQVETIQLHHLALRFRWRGQKDNSLPVLDAPFLRGLCEGPVGDSLLMLDIEKESVTPDGLPVLERLMSLAAANAKSREEREGRGRWQRQWGTIK